MKYIIDIPDDKNYAYVNDEKTFLRIPISLGENKIKSISAPTCLRIASYTEPDRKDIEDEVWRFLAFLINEMDTDDKDKCFGMLSIYKIVSTMSYQEAKDKYEEWKKQKEEENVNEFLVGDEVIGSKGTSTGVVTKVYGGGEYLAILGKYGFGSDKFDARNFRKTGRHFDEVEELLEKMREDT